jgi:pimeloyl-ACP methyl ester carboxylesterase
VVTYDRPGYGRSSRHHGRTVADCAADVAAIADALGVERFAVRGGSGGGPHALAVAALLGDRVTRVACDVPIAPFDADGLDWYAGMDPANVRETGWALAGEATLAPELDREVREALARVDDDPVAILGDVELPASDLAILRDPALREIWRAATVEMFAQGATGWIDDDLAIFAPWGFSFADVRAPVEIRYGAADVLAPAGHGAWLAEQVPRARVAVGEGGHLSTPDQQLERLLALVTPAAG